MSIKAPAQRDKCCSRIYRKYFWSTGARAEGTDEVGEMKGSSLLEKGKRQSEGKSMLTNTGIQKREDFFEECGGLQLDYQTRYNDETLQVGSSSRVQSGDN